MSTFARYDLLPTLLTTLKELEFTTPTEIQERAISPLLKGKSLVGIAETGSGKTLAFVLPMLHHLKTLEENGSSVSEPGRPRGVVLVPARELGEQVTRVFKSFTHDTRLRVRSVLGGTKKQIARQNVGGKFEILVATPGRVEQLLESKELRFDDVRMLVLDEADQMLDAGFGPGMQRIREICPSGAQTALFSATMPSSVQKMVRTVFREDPVRIRTKGSQQLVATLTTDNRTVTSGQRQPVLEGVMKDKTPSILFTNTRDQCDTVSRWLEDWGVAHVTYRGQMDRQERRNNLAKFRSGEVHVLVSTDLGGRGLDIERVDRVVNVFMPRQLENYLHRVGRTARAGRAGRVVNLVTQRDHPLLTKLKKRAKK